MEVPLLSGGRSAVLFRSRDCRAIEKGHCWTEASQRWHLRSPSGLGTAIAVVTAVPLLTGFRSAVFPTSCRKVLLSRWLPRSREIASCCSGCR